MSGALAQAKGVIGDQRVRMSGTSRVYSIETMMNHHEAPVF